MAYYSGVLLSPNVALIAANDLLVQVYTDAVALNNLPIVNSDKFLETVQTAVRTKFGGNFDVRYFDTECQDFVDILDTGSVFCLIVEATSTGFHSVRVH